MNDIENQLDSALELAKEYLSDETDDLVTVETVEESPESIVSSIENRDEDIEDDYVISRDNIYELMGKGKKALDGILELAEDDESARTFEVAGQILKTVSELNKEAIELQIKLEELKSMENKGSPKNITNNAVFVGSTSELQKLLKGEKSNGEKS
jgi:hypothetical protein